ncbi:DUF1761 domain-containing protein [uncultured Pseudoteredinibacter sp.]|uniref:DUF1761 domain-containing protein n=1 Tax=uncultured Pseudoteredinibacter sp. TaxID=1641701 RepID=UPI00262628A2|nr:DUF1761 domain-containing protein [uncultured Pseudoteredinibacter sp.]
MSFNFMALGLATAVSFFGGFFWYSVLFSKPWMKALGIKREDVDGSGLSILRAVSASVVASAATAIGIMVLFSYIQPSSWGLAALFGAGIWFCFSINAMFKMIFWEDRPAILFFIDSGFELFSVVMASLIIYGLS